MGSKTLKVSELPLNIHVRLWGGAINRITASAIFPFIALFLSEVTSKSFASLYLTLTICCTFISNIISGYCIDRFPRKVILLIFSYLEFILSVFMLIFLWKNIIIFFIITHFIYVNCSTFRRPSLKAIVQDSVNEETKKITYRLDYWLINLSIALGTLLGGALYSNNKILLFLVFSLSSLFISLLYTLFINEETSYVNKVKHNNIIKDLLTSYKNVSRDTRFILLVLGITLLYTGEMTISNYIAVRLNDDFNYFTIFDVTINGARMFAIINLVNTLIVAFFTLYIGNIIEKFNIKFVFIFGLTLYTLGYTSLMSANHFIIIIIAIVIATFGELIYAPIYNSEQLSLIPKSKRGSYNAFSALSITGSELLSRLTIILGVFFSPLAMSLIMFFTLSLGSLIVFRSLFEKSNE